MCPLFIVVHQPFIQLNLQAFQIGIELLSERHLIELLQDGLMESLTDTIRLRRLCLGLGVIDIVEGQVELVVVFFSASAVLGSSVSQNAQYRQLMAFEERQYPIVQ